MPHKQILGKKIINGKLASAKSDNLEKLKLSDSNLRGQN
jgi:hypothetical protein